MRIVTWNCRQGKILEKFEQINTLKPDLLVVPEGDDVDLPNQTARYWLPPKNNKKHGLGVYSFGNFSISRITRGSNAWGLYLPVKVYRYKKYVCNLIGVWTKPKEDSGDYTDGTVDILGRYAKTILEKETVLVGDFNSAGGWKTHQKILTKTEQLGLVSAFHEFHLIEQSKEKIKHSTHLHMFKNFKGHNGVVFLIDHMFIPLTWRRRIKNAKIGTKKSDKAIKIKGALRSDHRPLLVEIDLDINLNRNSHKFMYDI